MDRKRQKPVVVDGIDITRKYPIDEILKMHAAGRLRPVGVAGYIVRADANGMVGFVPWTESTLYRMEQDKTLVHASDDFVDTMRDDIEREYPMVRRTPQERVAAMMVRLMGTAAKTGNVPGLTAEQVTAITGKAWREGEPLSAMAVQAVAAHFLGVAQTQNREADRKRVTRQHALA